MATQNEPTMRRRFLSKSLAAASKPSNRRRRLVQMVFATPFLSPLYAFVSNKRPTPTQTAGPFYPRQLAVNAKKHFNASLDADLTRIGPETPEAAGEALRLLGDIVDTQGKPIADAHIEIWQCDATGHYHHPADRPDEERDDHFQGYGQTRSGADGAYAFRTIVPVPYPGRTPHIHFAVTAANRQPITTQMYLSRSTSNSTDMLYNRFSADDQTAVTVELKPDATTGENYHAYFQIVLA